MSTSAAPVSFVHAPKVAFLASRNYVHSTDLYQELMAGARALGFDIDGPIELRIRRLITNQPEFHYAQSSKGLPSDSPGVFSLSASGILWHGVIFERDAPVVHRKPYDEMELWTHAVQDGEAILFEGKTCMQPIEVVTALNLLLHRRLFSIAHDRKWFLTRIALRLPLLAEDARAVRIELTRTLGAKMTRSSIETGRGSIGSLEFMLGEVR
jgi:hypothetical protein